VSVVLESGMGMDPPSAASRLASGGGAWLGLLELLEHAPIATSAPARKIAAKRAAALATFGLRMEGRIARPSASVEANLC
jgi:hypothetical protein